MSPSRLLCASDFCREQTPRRVPVAVELLKESPRKTKQRIVDSAVYVSVDLLVALSLKVEKVAWLSSGFLPGIPVIVLVDEDRANNQDNKGFVVRVPPTIAASIGARNNDSSWLQTHHEDLPDAAVVKVRPIGRPVLCSWKDYPKSFPNLASSETRLLARLSLISILESNGLYVFEVVEVESCLGKQVDAAFTTCRTKWSLEPLQRDSNVRRLPPLSLATSFHASVISNEGDESIDQSCGGASCPQTELSLHPSLPEIKSALLLPPAAPASHRILHVMGTEENHVDVCIKSAADSLGLRYIRIRGLAAHAHASELSVSTGSLADQLVGCKAALRHAQECVPCVLHLCNVDHEWSQEDEPMRQMQQQRLWTVLVDTLEAESDFSSDSLSSYTPSVVVVLSTTKPLPAGPLMHNLIFRTITMRFPDETYARFLWNEDSTFDELYATHLVGRSALDICHLQRYWKYCGYSVEALDAFCKQMDLKKRKSTPHIPTVQWNDVGGLVHVRNEIMDAIELPLKHPKLFPSSGGRSGILLYGPPGTGKTLIAKAVATECGLPFLSVKGPELLGSYVGESEANVRAIFAAARQSQGRTTAASVLFFDELDSLAPRRGDAGDNGGVMDRVVATLLMELDGASDCMVFVIGATNRPDLLDPSLLRPGRLDRLVYLGIATKAEDRAQILAALIRKFRLKPQDPTLLAWQVVDELPHNLTGADFSAVVSGALRKSLERVCSRAEDELKRRQVTERNLTLDSVLDEWNKDRLAPVVTADDLIEASKDVVPSVSIKQLADYERLRVQFSSS
jgi:AAA+ superfamily predicted ATPase